MTTSKTLVAYATIMIGNKIKFVNVYSDAAFQELNQHNVYLCIRMQAKEIEISSIYFNNLGAKISIN
jgi:hypothetical protein